MGNQVPDKCDTKLKTKITLDLSKIESQMSLCKRMCAINDTDKTEWKSKFLRSYPTDTITISEQNLYSAKLSIVFGVTTIEPFTYKITINMINQD